MKSAESSEARLVRAVGFKEVVALTINAIIGAGIFALPATTASILGPASPLAFLGAGLFMIVIVLCFAELGSRYERTGGAYLYASEAFNSGIAFVIGWMYLLARITSVAALSGALAGFAGYFFELVPPYKQFFNLAVLGILGFINYMGIRSSTRVMNFLTIAKLAPLLIFICVGFVLSDWNVYRAVAMPRLSDYSRTLLICMFAFSGYEVIAIPGAEMVNARRDVPRGILIGSIITILIYLSIQFIAVAVDPHLADSSRPLADVGQRLMGTGGGVLLTAGAICSTIGTLTALLLVGPRILFAMSIERQLPPLFAHIHKDYRTPDYSLIAFMLTTAVLMLISDFTNLATLSAMARLVTYIGSALALLVLRKKNPIKGGFRIPGGPILPVLTVAISVYLLSAATRQQLIYGTAAIAAGLILYAAKKTQSRQDTKDSQKE